MTADGQIAATLDAYFAAWNRMDFDALAGLWHDGDDGVYYVAEEIEEPLHSFDAIREYWRLTAAAVESVTLTPRDLRTRVLAERAAVATYQMRVAAKVNNGDKIGVDVRVSAILRQVDDDWRLIHYAESPLGALPFVRRAYRANADR